MATHAGEAVVRAEPFDAIELNGPRRQCSASRVPNSELATKQIGNV
jgi:hypothetical protein